MIDLKMISTLEDLRKITGLPSDNHDEALWDAGFNSDDWDVCFVSDVPLAIDVCGYEYPMEDAYWLLLKMGNHCVGYEHVEFNGKHYYMVYHS